MIAVADTHAVYWALTGQTKKLGRQARRFFERAEQGQCTIYIPTFVLVEIGELSHRGRITLPMPYAEWSSALSRSQAYQLYDLTLDVAQHAQRLFDIPERSDRIIAATALALDCPLITRDAEIADCAAVQRLWD